MIYLTLLPNTFTVLMIQNNINGFPLFQTGVEKETLQLIRILRCFLFIISMTIHFTPTPRRFTNFKNGTH